MALVLMAASSVSRAVESTAKVHAWWDPAWRPEGWVKGKRFCGHHPVLRVVSPGEEESITLFFKTIGMLCVLWTILWYLSAALTHVFVTPRLPRSSVERENSTVYVSQKFVAELKCLVVAALANVAVVHMWGQAGSDVYEPNVQAELAGDFFLSFEIVDLVLGSLHGFLTQLYVLHHVLHIVLGLIIRGNCTLGFPAAVLMSQETSSVFLNFYLLMRFRSAHWSVTRSRDLFALSFGVWRIFLNTYGTLHFVRNYRDFMDPDVVEWQMHVMAVVLVLAMVLQWYWGYEIVRSAIKSQKKSD